MISNGRKLRSRGFEPPTSGMGTRRSKLAALPNSLVTEYIHDNSDMSRLATSTGFPQFFPCMRSDVARGYIIVE
jgi:hypothetical protein